MFDNAASFDEDLSRWKTHGVKDMSYMFESASEFNQPIGEWNTSKIVARGKRLQHYLNGELVVDITVGSDEWNAAHKKSKFKNRKEFAMNLSGRIFLQDHGNQVWFRKMEVKELTPAK